MSRDGETLAALEFALYRAAAQLVRGWSAAVCGMARDEARRDAWRERRGDWPWPGGERGPWLWLHAASVGETRIALTLAAALRRLRPDACLLLTCNTVTARGVAEQAGTFDAVRYFPVDHPRVVAPILDRLEPAAYIFVETEIWPSLLLELDRRGIPSALVNGRISDRSFPRYRLASALMRRALATLSVVCSRDERSQERLLSLGSPAARTRVTGDIKLDAFEPQALQATPDLVARCGGRFPVVVAASTHAGEETVVLEAYERASAHIGELRLVIAPRHPDRAEEAARLAAARGYRVIAWSAWAAGADWQVLIVDTVGDLLGFIKGAASVFVGGSLVPVGGHNLMEPAAFAVPAATGPQLASVEDQAEALAAAGALYIVRDAGELAGLWTAWLDDGDGARAIGAKARAVIERNRGALKRSLEMLGRCGVL